MQGLLYTLFLLIARLRCLALTESVNGTVEISFAFLSRRESHPPFSPNYPDLHMNPPPPSSNSWSTICFAFQSYHLNIRKIPLLLGSTPDMLTNSSS